MRFIFLLLFIPLFSMAQKVKVSEYDKFIKQYRIETNQVALKWGMSSGVSVGLRSVNNTIFLKLEGLNYVRTGVAENGQLIFLTNTDSTITAYSKELQFTSRNQHGEGFSFEYKIDLASLKKLQTATITGMRIYGTGGYQDVELKDKHSQNINDLVTTFLNEFESKQSEINKANDSR